MRGDGATGGGGADGAPTGGSPRPTLPGLLDDWLRTVTRTRPWTAGEEEDRLTPFLRWAEAEGGVEGTDAAALARGLEAALPAWIARMGMEGPEAEAFQGAVGTFLRWAEGAER